MPKIWPGTHASGINESPRALKAAILTSLCNLDIGSDDSRAGIAYANCETDEWIGKTSR